jgi:CheY-like chemotaxis protein/signal transduction histidine kinase
MDRILIVDDNQQNLYMLKILLETNGYQVESASDGREALDLAHQSPPDLVISDILMPGMDGFSFCRAWKSDAILCQIPFIFYTATYTDEKDEAFALNLGADRFLLKPSTPNEILTAIQGVAQQKPKIADPSQVQPQNDSSYYREYNEVLIQKLEQKMSQLDLANKRLTSLYQASCDLITLKSQGEIIHDVLQTIVETGSYGQINYFYYEQEESKLYLLDAVGFSKKTLTDYRDQLNFSLGETKGIVGVVAADQQIINIPDTSLEPNWIILDTLIKSALFVPVTYQKALFGVIGVFSKDKDAFDPVDQQNIFALANSLAITFENRKAEREIQRLNLQLERRVAERTNQLELSNRELETFAYSVSNDLRIPLRAIHGYAQLLVSDFTEQLGSEGQKMVEIIHASTKKMNQIINGLMEISRASMKDLTVTRVKMGKLVKSVYQETALPQETERINFQLENIPDAYTDQKMIHQVWTNLLSSAIKFAMKADNPHIKVFSKEENQMIIYAIQSNGTGVDIERVNAFLLSKGVGLQDATSVDDGNFGLAIVQRIVERHKGKVWAETTPEGEFQIQFSLPIIVETRK